MFALESNELGCTRAIEHEICIENGEPFKEWFQRILYEFTCMSFGLCNAPAMFQHFMQNTLGELNLTYCVIYLEDVIVFGRMEEEHLECICMVFERF